MNITEVRSFLILAGQLHFEWAARLLHLSQPGLTKQIVTAFCESLSILLSRSASERLPFRILINESFASEVLRAKSPDSSKVRLAQE